jgi:YggT family protein
VVVVGIIIEFVLWFYILFILVRLVVDWVQMFARSWHPSGPGLVALELVYSATDPPILLIRKVVPPLRLGGQALDFSVMFVLLVCYIALWINRRTLLFS